MTDDSIRFVAPSTGERLDRLVADATGRGRRLVREWLLAGCVTVDGRIARGSDVPAAGSAIVVEVPAAAPAPTPPLPIRILYEDSRLVLLDKPAGLHCERGRSAGSVAELLEERFGDRGAIGERAAEAGLVHRLDRDTSGALVAAKDRASWLRLRRAFSSGATRKSYLALAAGRLGRATRVDRPLARRGSGMAPAAARDAGIEAKTWLDPLETGRDWTLVLATMRTGAMHQVRAHLALAGHPILGDESYGGEALPGCPRRGQLLHALRVEIAGELDATVAPPADFLTACALLRRSGG